MTANAYPAVQVRWPHMRLAAIGAVLAGLTAASPTLHLAYGGWALMLVFIGASIAAKARGIDISCGCFGHVSDQLSFAWHMVLDFAIFAAVIALWRWDGGNPRVAGQSGR